MRWVYFAFKRRGLYKMLSSHVMFRLRFFILGVSALFVCPYPGFILSRFLLVCYPQGRATLLFLSSRKNYHRKLSGTPRLSRYSFFARSRSSSVGAVLNFPYRSRMTILSILSVTVCDSRDGYFDTARCQKYRHNRHVLSHIFCIVFPEP